MVFTVDTRLFMNPLCKPGMSEIPFIYGSSFHKANLLHTFNPGLTLCKHPRCVDCKWYARRAGNMYGNMLSGNCSSGREIQISTIQKFATNIKNDFRNPTLAQSCPVRPQVLDHKILLLDEAHQLLHPGRYFWQLQQLRRQLAAAQGSVVVGFSGTLALDQLEEGRQLLEIVKGGAETVLCDEGAQNGNVEVMYP